ncbi:hypothetical protein QZH41_012825 [Actinostola sp. cb2023]|nr:hypothetical protein QZH41_012825 [Actinostola sp. cb2023]
MIKHRLCFTPLLILLLLKTPRTGYTLECNYNSGRMLNPVPPATCDSGRATPPPPPGFPPKFTTEIYEEVGRALVVSVLDMTNCNPWSRLPTSEFSSVEGVRNWVRRFIKSAKNAPSIPKKLSRIAAKTSSLVAGATASTRQKISSTLKSTTAVDLSAESLSAAALKVTERMTQNVNGNECSLDLSALKKVLEEPKPPKRIQCLAAPRRLSQPLSSSSFKSSTTSKVIPGFNGGLQMHKSKEQLRVSLELPKTGPSLRIPKPNQLLSANVKALSCPADLRIGIVSLIDMLLLLNVLLFSLHFLAEIIGNGINSCEVVDVTELPQSGSQSVGYWVEMHDLSTVSH